MCGNEWRPPKWEQRICNSELAIAMYHLHLSETQRQAGEWECFVGRLELGDVLHWRLWPEATGAEQKLGKLIVISQVLAILGRWLQSLWVRVLLSHVVWPFSLCVFSLSKCATQDTDTDVIKPVFTLKYLSPVKKSKRNEMYTEDYNVTQSVSQMRIKAIVIATQNIGHFLFHVVHFWKWCHLWAAQKEGRGTNATKHTFHQASRILIL